MKISARPACLPSIGAIFCLLLGVSASAQVKRPDGVSISPDGATVAWSVKTDSGSQIHLTDVANPDPAKEKIVAPNGATGCWSTAPMWSPDGQWLAYSSTCTGKKDGQAQIFLWSKASGESKQLTHVKGLFDQAAWSPNGKSIAFLFIENATRSSDAGDAIKPWAGVVGEDGIEIQRIAVTDISTGAMKQVTPTNLHAYEFGWAPDSKELAYIAANPPGDNNWWIANLYCQKIGEEPKVVLNPSKTSGGMHGLQMAVPRWSPDGKRIAFIGGLMSDQGSTGGDVWIVDAKGSDPIDITSGIDGTPSFEAWLDNNTIGMVEERRGKVRMPDYDVAKRSEIPGSAIELGEVSVSGGALEGEISATDKGVFAFVKSSFASPPEIWVGPGDALKQITHLNDGATPGPKVESIEYDNEGFHVQGWLTYPDNYDPSKKYPMLVGVHGGPSSMVGAGWGGPGAMWAQRGYFVFSPNPRGSFGQGEKFTAANIRDFGYGDLRDILAGVDFIEKKVSIDDKRLGMYGWSYGGFMSMFAATRTQRFAAIIAGAGISNWQSYYGQNSIDQWMIPFFGASVYDDPAVYAKSSAIEFIKKAKTPMLILVGDRDGECPAPQSFEMWHALRALGVKTQLVVYPNEGHDFHDPEHIKDRADREIKWFAENMPQK